MARPKKTEVQLQETRARILDTALAILQEEGPEAISSRAIAERMHVTHMSLYTYFENQPAIMSALREREMSKWRGQQHTFEERAQREDIQKVVEEILRFFITFARENPNLYRLAWVMPQVAGESSDQTRLRLRTTVEHLANLLKSGMDQNVFEAREPFITAGTVLAMVNTPYIMFHSGRLVDPAIRDHMVEEMFHAAMLYLKKK